MTRSPADAESLREAWRARWPEALALWGRFTRLAEPIWCTTVGEEKAAGLASSFAMIRLQDHAIVISLRRVLEQKVDAFPVEVMAHEIGHHVLAPGDLHDHGRMLARVRHALAIRADQAPFIANLYTDLLINDRLQRSARLRMAQIYHALKTGPSTRLWLLYMRIYESLWELPRNTLAFASDVDPQLEFDARLGARLVRSYATEWLAGSGPFAMLCLPYLLADTGGATRKMLVPLLDTEKAGEGGSLDGLAEVEDAERDAVHPVEDPAISGIDADHASASNEGEAKAQADPGHGVNRRGSTRPRERVFRSPIEYRDLLASAGVTVDPQDALIRYYHDAARPYVVPFPTRETARASDPQPEGLDVWDAGSPLDEIDWFETAVVSPVVVPGLTTVKRTYGTVEGLSPERRPVDLFLGVDCSGSMVNPAHGVSYPVIGGAIMVLSALRANARVMVALSGEPGKYEATNGFVADEHDCLRVLTGFLGTGYTFGIPRLRDAFASRRAHDPPAHIVIVTDYDIFTMLDGKDGGRTGWQIAADALARAGGGGTYLLHSPYSNSQVDRMRADGWDVHFVTDWRGVIAFAQAFSAKHYGGAR